MILVLCSNLISTQICPMLRRLKLTEEVMTSRASISNHGWQQLFVEKNVKCMSTSVVRKPSAMPSERSSLEALAQYLGVNDLSKVFPRSGKNTGIVYKSSRTVPSDCCKVELCSRLSDANAVVRVLLNLMHSGIG